MLAKLLGLPGLIQDLGHRQAHLRMGLQPGQQARKRARLPTQIGVEHPQMGRQLGQGGHQTIHSAAVTGVIRVGEELIRARCQAIHRFTGAMVVSDHRITDVGGQSLQTPLQLLHLRRRRVIGHEQQQQLALGRWGLVLQLRTLAMHRRSLKPPGRPGLKRAQAGNAERDRPAQLRSRQQQDAALSTGQPQQSDRGGHHQNAALHQPGPGHPGPAQKGVATEDPARDEIGDSEQQRLLGGDDGQQRGQHHHQEVEADHGQQHRPRRPHPADTAAAGAWVPMRSPL